VGGKRRKEAGLARRLLAAAAVCMCASGPAVPDAAAGDGMFLLCYERIKQMVRLVVVQGGHVEEVEDDPNHGKYRVVIYQISGNKEIRCLPKGGMTVEAAAEAPPDD
jgi:hypothetical protein